MKLISWNVNGIREQLTSEILEGHGYHTYWHSGVKKGYSSVATFL